MSKFLSVKTIFFLFKISKKLSNFFKLEKRHPSGEIIFIGDGIENGGNDYPLAELMDNTEICDWYHTKGWEHTKEILESLSD